MQLERRIGGAPRSEALARQLAAMPGPCVGCTGCRGLCAALIEMLSLPDAILDRDRGAGAGRLAGRSLGV